MRPTTVIALCTLPGLAAATIGRLVGQNGIADGGLYAAMVAALAAVWLVVPMGSGAVVQAARLGLAFFTRLAGALLVAALVVQPGHNHADLLVTLIACLLAAMAAEMALLLRVGADGAQESARV